MATEKFSKFSNEEAQMVVGALEVKIQQVRRAEAAESDPAIKVIRQAQVQKLRSLAERVMSKEFVLEN